MHALLERAKQLRLIIGFFCENDVYEVTHSQFADDTIIFCDANLAEVENLKSILKSLELFSGLKINYHYLNNSISDFLNLFVISLFQKPFNTYL